MCTQMHKRRTEESKQIHEPDSDHHDPDSGSRGKQVPASGAEEDTASETPRRRKREALVTDGSTNKRDA